MLDRKDSREETRDWPRIAVQQSAGCYQTDADNPVSNNIPPHFRALRFTPHMIAMLHCEAEKWWHRLSSHHFNGPANAHSKSWTHDQPNPKHNERGTKTSNRFGFSVRASYYEPMKVQ